jgi:UDP-GlcNAc:undecaprenyl-phosphate GlcNAc-1-phosphate transferase
VRFLPWYACGAAVVGALVTWLLVPPAIRIAIALRAMDQPGGRKLQASAVPRLGGVAIFCGIGLAAGCAALGQWDVWGTAAAAKEILALACGTALVFAVGVADDLVGVGSGKKFLVELGAAGLLVAVGGWSFSVLRLPFVGAVDLGVFGGLVSLLWIVGVTNAINLIDGLDGLAGGVVAIIAASMLGYAVLQGSPGTVVLMAATAGACLGFLRHNRGPARTFMGDSGALTLGFLLAGTSVHSALKAPAAVAILVPILALGLPVMDTLLVMGVRFLDRPRRHPARRFLRMFRADRKHLHYLLGRVGARRPHVVTLIYAVVVAFCAMALVVAVTGQTNLGLSLVVIEFLVILSMRRLGRNAWRRPMAGAAQAGPGAEMLRFPAAPLLLAAPSPAELRISGAADDGASEVGLPVLYGSFRLAGVLGGLHVGGDLAPAPTSHVVAGVEGAVPVDRLGNHLFKAPARSPAERLARLVDRQPQRRERPVPVAFLVPGAVFLDAFPAATPPAGDHHLDQLPDGVRHLHGWREVPSA